jgi:O-antigen/teichoic acid export membrane protein
LSPSGYDPQLQQKTRRSIGWLIGETVLEQSFSFLIFVLMARTLSKAELGTFAIIFVIMDMGRAVTSAGVFQRVARAKELSPVQLDTMFWLNVILGGLYCLAMLVFAHYAQAFFHAPLLEPVTRWLTVALMASALGNTHMALRLRHFGHRTLAVRSLIAGFLGAVVAVAGILAGFGLAAFVLQRIIREVVLTIFAWRSFSWQPRIRFDVQQAKVDLKFGKDIVSAQLVGYLTLRSQDLMIARFMGPILLSTYRVAWRSAELLGPQLVSTFSIVSLQTFSRLQDNKPALRTAYRSLLRYCALLTVPALVGYAASGPWLVPALFGPQWHSAGMIAVPLGLLAVPFAVTYFFQSLLSALGHAKWQRQIAVLDMLSNIPVCLIAIRFGIMWVAVSYVVRAYLMIPIEIHLMRKVSGIGLRDHFWAYWPSVAAAAVMIAAIVPLFLTFEPENLLGISAICLFGAVLYGLAVWALVPEQREQVRALLGGRTGLHGM